MIVLICPSSIKISIFNSLRNINLTFSLSASVRPTVTIVPFDFFDFVDVCRCPPSPPDKL